MIPSADDAARMTLDIENPLLDRAAQKIRWAAEDGSLECKVDILEGEWQFYDRTVAVLRAKGYEVSYSRACLWLEVSWEESLARVAGEKELPE